MAIYKLQVQQDASTPDVWRDVLADSGTPLLFEKEQLARAELAQRFPVLVKMGELGLDRIRARVIIVNPYQDIDEERDE
jgi:hypothetical protein